MSRLQLQLGDDPRTVMLQRCWNAALRTLSHEVSKATFEGYIRRIRPKSWDERVVTLAVPSPFACAWLSGRYAPIIRHALESELANRVELHFVVEPQLESPTAECGLRVEDGGLSDMSGTRAAHVKSGIHRPKSRFLEPDESDGQPIEDSPGFDGIVVGPSNRLAARICEEVAESPATRYNPLVLIGPSGVGKTRLLQAIAARVSARDPALRMSYLDGESFTYRLQAGTGTPERRAADDLAEVVDLWLVDDAQFVLEREPSRDEFYHVLNELLRTGRQVVVTSDRPLRATGVADRIRSRLEGGLVVEIEPPDLGMRTAIVERLFRREQTVAPGEVVYLIANGVRANIRSLQGAVTKLLAYCRAMNAPLRVPTASEILAEYLVDAPVRGWLPKGVAMEAILEAVGEQFGVVVEDIRGEELDRRTVRARQATMFLARQLTELGYTDIGRALGRDHATVKRGVERIKTLMEKDPRLRADIQEAHERLT